MMAKKSAATVGRQQIDSIGALDGRVARHNFSVHCDVQRGGEPGEFGVRGDERAEHGSGMWMWV